MPSIDPSTKPYTMPIDLNALIVKTFLSLYDVTTTHKHLYPEADYIFAMGGRYICLLNGEQQVAPVAGMQDVNKKQVNTTHVAVAKQLFARYERCIDSLKQTNQQALIANTYFIAISKITAMHGGVQKEIAHEYGSAFYKKHFTHYYQHQAQSRHSTDANKTPERKDATQADNEANHEVSDKSHDKASRLQAQIDTSVLQLFSINSLRHSIHILPTPIDFLAFINFHKQLLNNKPKYRQETKLASIFLMQPAFFMPALIVERKLVEVGLLDKVESRLLKACQPVQLQSAPANANTQNQQNVIVKGGEGIKVRETLIPKMHKFAELYHRIIGSSIHNRYKTNEMLPISLAQLLISESMYTRLCLMEEFMAYPNQSSEDKSEGYERHQHSFNVFGRHYMMIFYGTDAEAFYSRANVKEQHEDLLLEINAELQSPVMQDIFILGFELVPSADKNDSNMEVVLDIYHRKGAVLTDSDKARLAQLDS